MSNEVVEKMSEINTLMEDLFTLKETNLTTDNYLNKIMENHRRITKMGSIINRVSALKDEVNTIMIEYEKSADSSKEKEDRLSEFKSKMHKINSNLDKAKNFMLMEQKLHSDL